MTASWGEGRSAGLSVRRAWSSQDSPSRAARRARTLHFRRRSRSTVSRTGCASSWPLTTRCPTSVSWSATRPGKAMTLTVERGWLTSRSTCSLAPSATAPTRSCSCRRGPRTSTPTRASIPPRSKRRFRPRRSTSPSGSRVRAWRPPRTPSTKKWSSGNAPWLASSTVSTDTGVVDSRFLDLCSKPSGTSFTPNGIRTISPKMRSRR